jgi:hypothetical protein
MPRCILILSKSIIVLHLFDFVDSAMPKVKWCRQWDRELHVIRDTVAWFEPTS